MFPFWAKPMHDHRMIKPHTRKEMAAALGCAYTHYCNMELGALKPGRKIMARFCEITGMDLDYGLTLIGRPSETTIRAILETAGCLPKPEPQNFVAEKEGVTQ